MNCWDLQRINLRVAGGESSECHWEENKLRNAVVAKPVADTEVDTYAIYRTLQTNQKLQTARTLRTLILGQTVAVAQVDT